LDLPIDKLHNPWGASCDAGVVRGDDQCHLPFLAQSAQEIDDLAAGV